MASNAGARRPCYFVNLCVNDLFATHTQNGLGILPIQRSTGVSPMKRIKGCA